MTQIFAAALQAPRRVPDCHGFVVLAVFVLGTAVLYAVYALAQELTWQFDDYVNLKTLADASSLAGVLNFVFGGDAGPLGRSLSLITFLANYGDWPTNPWGMVQLTFVLHAINGALVFLLLRRILLCKPLRDVCGDRAQWLALATALFWLWLPIHASGLLIPVQRMTHVSAFFALVSLYGFMILRQRQRQRVGVPSLGGMMLISLWLGATILAAAFAKENGIVAITFVFLLEVFCFYPVWKDGTAGAASVSSRAWRLWLGLAGGAVAGLLLVHVATRWEGIRQAFELYRGYRWSEHIATQWVISWEYLRQIVVPRSALLGPFQDNHTVYTWTAAPAYVAIALWGGFIWGSVRLGRSQTHALGVRALGWVACAAIFWFFAGHQVESALIPLELYFEHRNYLSSLGFCLLVVLGFDQFFRAARRTVVPLAVAVIYLAYMAFSLFQITSLWGQPLLAHDLWQKNHPHSTRAAQSVIQDLMAMGYQDAAFDFADEFIKNQRALDVSIAITALRCKHRNAAEQAVGFKQLQQLVAELRVPGGIPTGLATLGNAVRNGDCASPSMDDYEAFLNQLLTRPQVEHAIKVRHHVHYELALMAKQRDDMDAYIDYLKKAFWDYPSISVAQLVASTLFKEQRIDEAITWIDTVIKDAPNASLRKAWRDTLNSMREALLHIQKSLHESTLKLDVQAPPSQ